MWSLLTDILGRPREQAVGPIPSGTAPVPGQKLVEQAKTDAHQVVEQGVTATQTGKVHDRLAQDYKDILTASPELSSRSQVSQSSEITKLLKKGDPASLKEAAKRIEALANEAIARQEAAKAKLTDRAQAKDRKTLSTEAKVELAKNSRDPQVLLKLAHDKDLQVRAEVALNEHSLSDTLRHLASDHDPVVRRGVLFNEKTPPDALATIAHYPIKGLPDALVRQGVAHNARTPAKILADMAGPKQPPNVRAAVAENEHAPRKLLQKLAKDKDPEVAQAAQQTLASVQAKDKEDLAHTSKDRKVLAKLADDTDPTIRERVAGNPNALPELSTKLAHDSNWRVRRGVAQNPHAPRLLLEELAKDPMPMVARAARETLTKTGN